MVGLLILVSGAKLRFIFIARLLKNKRIGKYAQSAKRIKEKYRYPRTLFNLVELITIHTDIIEQKKLDKGIKDESINFWDKLANIISKPYRMILA